MNRKTLLWIVFILILIAVAVFLFLGGGERLGLLAAEPPSVQIVQPQGSPAIRSGDVLALLVEAQGASGIARVDLLYNGLLVASHYPDDPSRGFFATPFTLFASRVGEFVLEAIAYDHNGQASPPAQITVAVHPLGEAQRNGVPDNLPPGSNIEPINQNLPNAAEAGGGDQADNGGEGEGAGQNANQEDAFQAPAPEEAPAPVDDNAPSIEVFEYDLEFDGQAFEALIDARASDDLGVARLDFIVSSGQGGQQTFSLDCGGQALCELAISAPLSPGEWLLSVQAIDTSGQASEPELLIAEVLGGQDQPPAAAEHDENWNDWFAGQFGDLADPAIDFNWNFNQPSVDLAALLEFLGRGNQVEEVEARFAHCLEVSGGRGDGFNRVSFEVTCDDLVAPEDRIVYVNIDKRLPNQQDGGIGLHIPDWYDETRTRFSPGDNLSWDDHDVVCGMDYQYAVRISLATVRDPGRNHSSAVATGETLAYAEFVIESQACREGSLGDVDLQATLDAANHMQLSWQFPVDANWPQEPPIDNGLRVQLLRYSPFLDEQHTVFEQVLSVDQINAQPGFAINDPDVVCNTSYWYTLQVISADADLGLVSPGWIIRRPVEAPRFACENAPLDDWFDVSTYWHNDRYHKALVEVSIPEDAEFPQGERVEVWLEYYREGSGQCNSPPCDGNYKVFHGNWLVNGQVQSRVYEKFFDLACGGEDYLVRMAIAVDRVGVQYSNTVRVSSVKCPPPSPTIISLFATTSNCPANVDRCVHVEWAPYQQALDLERYELAERIVVQRRNLNGEFVDFFFELGATSWIDTNPLVFNLDLHPDFQCEVPVMYRLAAYDANGRWYGASPLQLNGLTCDGAWNLRVGGR